MKYEKVNSDKSLLADSPWCRLGYSCQDPRKPPLFIIFLSSLRIDPYVQDYYWSWNFIRGFVVILTFSDETISWLTALSGLISSGFVSQEPACGVLANPANEQTSKQAHLRLKNDELSRFWLSLLCLVNMPYKWLGRIGTCTDWTPKYLVCCDWYARYCIIFGTTRELVADSQKEVGIHNRKRRWGR